MRLSSWALLAACAAALVAIASASAAKSPAALIAALEKAKVTNAQLPKGYKSPVVGPYKVTAAIKKHGAVGGVQIFADGGNEAIIYIVFKNAAAAKLDWTHANFHGQKTESAPSSIPKPNVVVNLTATPTVNGKTVKFGLTEVATLSGNVIVQSITSSEKTPTHGDKAGAVALAVFALKHLAAAR
jgi:hypothetical protein